MYATKVSKFEFDYIFVCISKIADTKTYKSVGGWEACGGRRRGGAGAHLIERHKLAFCPAGAENAFLFALRSSGILCLFVHGSKLFYRFMQPPFTETAIHMPLFQAN